MENEMLEQTNETENTGTLAVEETNGVELTDTAVEENTVKKSLRDLLRENEDYQEELNQMINKRLDRKEREYQRELSKYKDTENVLRTTLNLKEGEDTNEKLRAFYEADGVKLPEKYSSGYSSRDLEYLAKRDAEEIIEEGYETMEYEANQLANKGYNNLDEREKVIFNTLAEKLKTEKNHRELKKLGASDELLTNSDFDNFKKKFTYDTPIEEIYSLYKTTQPKKQVENPGSMKNNSDIKPKKTYYTPDEARQLTAKDLDDPEVMKAVEDSMAKWYKDGIK